MPCSICNKKGHNRRTCFQGQNPFHETTATDTHSEFFYHLDFDFALAVQMQEMQEMQDQERGPGQQAHQEVNEEKEEKKKHDCAICLEDLAQKKQRALPCMHVFHMNCVNQWIREHRKCPICRHPVHG